MTESKPQRWRHLKRGSTYTEIARGDLQSTHPLLEGATLVAYRSEHDGRVWFRPQAEFEDGRFERLPDPSDSSPIPPEMPADEFRRLLVAWTQAEDEAPEKSEAWNLIADFATDNAALIVAALNSYSPPVSPIPPERVPEALRELAAMARRRKQIIDHLPEGMLQIDRLYSHHGTHFPTEALLEAEASRLEAELAAEGGAR